MTQRFARLRQMWLQPIRGLVECYLDHESGESVREIELRNIFPANVPWSPRATFQVPLSAPRTSLLRTSLCLATPADMPQRRARSLRLLRGRRARSASTAICRSGAAASKAPASDPARSAATSCQSRARAIRPRMRPTARSPLRSALVRKPWVRPPPPRAHDISSRFRLARAPRHRRLSRSPHRTRLMPKNSGSRRPGQYSKRVVAGPVGASGHQARTACSAAPCPADRSPNRLKQSGIDDNRSAQSLSALSISKRSGRLRRSRAAVNAFEETKFAPLSIANGNASLLPTGLAFSPPVCGCAPIG